MAWSAEFINPCSDLFFYPSFHQQWVQNVLTSCQMYKAVGIVRLNLTTRSQDVLCSTLPRLCWGSKEKLSIILQL
jgi:hypothetical protein